MLNLIKTHFQDYVEFLKKPQPAPNNQILSGRIKWRSLLIFLVIDAILVIPAVLLIYALQEFVDLDLDNHALSDLINDFGLFGLVILVGIVAPIIEEILFRLPLNYKRNYLFKLVGLAFGKKNVKNFWFKHYTVFFYLFIIAFGAVHISNYQDESIGIIVLSPILILPQLIGGTIIAYLRMNLGFLWGFLQHSTFNIALLLLSYHTHLEEKLVIDNEDFKLRVEVAETRFGNSKTITINQDFDFIKALQTHYAPYNQIAQKLNWHPLEQKENKLHFNITYEVKNFEIDSDSILQYHLTEIIQNQ